MNGIMSPGTRRERKDSQRRDQLAGELTALTEQLAGLKGEVAALRKERDRTREVTELEQQIETLKLEKARLTEEHAREVRETEHKVGLLLEKQQQDLEHTRRMTELEVREGNLTAERERFERDMKFQRDQLQAQIGDTKELVTHLLARLPVIEVSLDGPAKGTRGKTGGDD